MNVHDSYVEKFMSILGYEENNNLFARSQQGATKSSGHSYYTLFISLLIASANWE